MRRLLRGSLVLLVAATVLLRPVARPAPGVRPVSAAGGVARTLSGNRELRAPRPAAVGPAAPRSTARTPCAANRLPQLTLVSLSAQRAWMCTGSRLVRTTPVTTGSSAPGNATPTGSWRIQAKAADRYLYPATGGEYHVAYWMPYDGDYGIHDAAWQTIPFGSGAYRSAGSHGCVHLPTDVMAWFYRWSAVGSDVRVIA
jgi:lipoprotein-anchoring transpeptidase ErfK/SrfK